MNQSISSTIDQFSTVISTLFHPIISLILLFIYSSYMGEIPFHDELIHYVLLATILVLPIVLWIVWNVKSKRYTNFDVSDSKQRRSLYFFIESSFFIYILTYYLISAKIDFTISFLLVLILLLQVSNYFVKSSMHTAFNLFVAALFYNLNPNFGVVWIVITILVACSRYWLKRHSWKEIIWGATIGLVVSFAYLYTLNTIQLKVPL